MEEFRHCKINLSSAIWMNELPLGRGISMDLYAHQRSPGFLDLAITDQSLLNPACRWLLTRKLKLPSWTCHLTWLRIYRAMRQASLWEILLIHVSWTPQWSPCVVNVSQDRYNCTNCKDYRVEKKEWRLEWSVLDIVSLRFPQMVKINTKREGSEPSNVNL